MLGIKSRTEKEKDYENYWKKWHEIPLRKKIDKLMDMPISGSGRHFKSVLNEILDRIEAIEK